MPIYEYRCGECAQVFEEWQRGFEEHDANCPVCGGKSERLISNTSFVLKGTGWYVTDYKSSGNASAAGAGGSPKSASAESASPAPEASTPAAPAAASGTDTA